MSTGAPDKWREVRLEEVCRRITVGHVGPMANEYVAEGIPFLRSQNIMPFRIDLTDVKYVTLEFDRRLKKSALKPGDVAVVRTGYPGTAAVIPPSLPVANCADLVIITPSDAIDPWFLTCIFNSTWGKGVVAGNLVGVAQQHFNVGAAKNMRVFLPPLPTQRRIASILSAYDDLIENNTRRIAILEEMARRLYDEWFVQFRFPGHEGVPMVDSEIGKVPEGWELTRVASAVKRFTTGKKYNQKTVEPDGNVPVLDQGQSGVIGFHNDEPGFSASTDDPVIVFANHTCYQKLIFFSFSTIQNVIPYKCNEAFERDIFWLYHATYGLVELNDYKGHWPQFAARPVLVPPLTLAANFGLLVKPFHILSYNLSRTNSNLRAQRDLLLPKLISGEIDVSEAREPAEEAAA